MVQNPFPTCSISIPEIPGCLQDFIKVLPTDVINDIASAANDITEFVTSNTLDKIDAQLAALENKLVEMNSLQNELMAKVAKLQSVMNLIDEYLNIIECVQLQGVRDMFSDQLNTANAKITEIKNQTLGRAIDELRSVRDAMECARNNARVLNEFTNRVSSERARSPVPDFSIDDPASFFASKFGG